MSLERGEDRLILQRVNHQFSTRGIRLTGKIQYEHQRKAAVQAATGVTGVRRVNDQPLVKQ